MELLLALLAVAAASAAGAWVARRSRTTWHEPRNVTEALTDYFGRRRVRIQKSRLLASFPDVRLPPLMPSQHGEEIPLWNFFQNRDGVFVEVGAHDGIHCSNTYFLEAIGWRGALIEADPELSGVCARNRPFSRVIHAAAGDGSSSDATFWQVRGPGGVDALSFTKPDPEHTERIRRAGGTARAVTVPSVSLAEITRDLDGDVDLLSIDVEGAEIEVLNGLDLERVRPAVIVVEINSAAYQAAIDARLTSAGYERRIELSVNHFYARPDDPRAFGS